VISGPYLFFLQLTFKSPSANSQKLSMTFTMPFSEDQKYRFSYEVSLIFIFHKFKTKNEISYDDDSRIYFLPWWTEVHLVIRLLLPPTQNQE
jgi:hypothetical protein